MNKTRIVLADDHRLLRTGLRVMIEREPDMAVVGEAQDGRETVEVVESLRPDVLILDIAMRNLNGIETAVAKTDSGLALVILSPHSDESYLLRALKAGARAYLLKDSAGADLVHAIRTVRRGKSFFSRALIEALSEDHMVQLRTLGARDNYELLTAREREVLKLLAERQSSKDVANLLSLSLYTVELDRGHILEKLALHTIPELVLYALRKGIIS
jgi:two-component system, NarL family, response regulator NreC